MTEQITSKGKEWTPEEAGRVRNVLNVLSDPRLISLDFEADRKRLFDNQTATVTLRKEDSDGVETKEVLMADISLTATALSAEAKSEGEITRISFQDEEWEVPRGVWGGLPIKVHEYQQSVR